MTLITIKDQSELKKYLKEGTDCVYEFRILGILVDVKFKCNIFDTRNKRVKEKGEDGGMVIFKAHAIIGQDIVVDRLEADKVKANSIFATYIFADKVKANVVESMNVEAHKVRCKMLSSLVLQARKIRADYVDICELRNCRKLKAKKVALISMDGGKIKAHHLSLNDKSNEGCFPMTKHSTIHAKEKEQSKIEKAITKTNKASKK